MAKLNVNTVGGNNEVLRRDGFFVSAGGQMSTALWPEPTVDTLFTQQSSFQQVAHRSPSGVWNRDSQGREHAGVMRSCRFSDRGSAPAPASRNKKPVDSIAALEGSA